MRSRRRRREIDRFYFGTIERDARPPPTANATDLIGVRTTVLSAQLASFRFASASFCSPFRPSVSKTSHRADAIDHFVSYLSLISHSTIVSLASSPLACVTSLTDYGRLLTLVLRGCGPDSCRFCGQFSRTTFSSGDMRSYQFVLFQFTFVY